ncbi:hypothetical protein TNCV_1864411 [Trichonephila clavipes]|nr:hypothetical protein TNCV_1864411 [Trichonephila clavipes]
MALPKVSHKCSTAVLPNLFITKGFLSKDNFTPPAEEGSPVQFDPWPGTGPWTGGWDYCSMEFRSEDLASPTVRRLTFSST